MLNAETARLKTLEAINSNTFEIINAIYRDIEDAIAKGRYNVILHIDSVYNHVTGVTNIQVGSRVVRCNLNEIVDFFENQGFECEVREHADIYRYATTATRFLVIDWGSRN